MKSFLQSQFLTFPTSDRLIGSSRWRNGTQETHWRVTRSTICANHCSSSTQSKPDILLTREDRRDQGHDVYRFVIFVVVGIAKSWSKLQVVVINFRNSVL